MLILFILINDEVLSPMAAPTFNYIGSLNTSIHDDIATDGNYIYATRVYSTSNYLRVYQGLTYLTEVLLPNNTAYGLLCKDGCIIVGAGKSSSTTFELQAYRYNSASNTLILVSTVTCGPLAGYGGLTGQVRRLCDGPGSYFFAALEYSGIGIFTFSSDTLSYISRSYGDIPWACTGVAYDSNYVYGVFGGRGTAAYNFSSGTLTFLKSTYLAYAGYIGDYNNVVLSDSADCLSIASDGTYVFVGVNRLYPHMYSNAVWALTFNGSNFNVIEQWIQDPTESYNSNYMWGLAAGKGCFYTTGRPLCIVYFDGTSFSTIESINCNADGSAVAYGNNYAVLNNMPTDYMHLYEIVTIASSFSSYPSSGNANLNVQFTDSSTGSPTSWLWSFGDGYTSTAQNPSHVYTTAGTYTVTLTIYKGTDSSVSTGTVTVTVNVISNITPMISYAPMTIQCNDMSTGVPDAREWSFGDGSPNSYQISPTHTYTTAGNYAVTLTVYKGVNSYSIAKTVTCLLKAVVIADVSTGYSPLLVNFTDSSTGNPTSWLWSFGDGTTSTDQNPSHTYTSTGNYTVTLLIGNLSGTASTTLNITVNANVDFYARPAYGYAPLVTYFTDRTISSPMPVSWLWSFGDGTTSTDQNPIHIYTEEGSYTVSLTVNNGLTTDQITKNNAVQVTSLKSEIIENIKATADNYGTDEVKKCLGTNGTEWASGSYLFMETVVTGIALAITGRTINRGEPFYGSLYKTITEFSDDNKMTLDQVYGLIIGDSLEVSSEFNSGGKVITDISKYTSDKYVLTSQLVNDETGSFAGDVQPPDQNLSVEDTIDRIQACIHDSIPRNSTEETSGLVRCSSAVSKISAPVNARETRINTLIDILVEAGLLI